MSYDERNRHEERSSFVMSRMNFQMIQGAHMNSATRGNGKFQRMMWVLGSASMLLLIGSAGLVFFAQQAMGQVSMATILPALHLASWSYVLGLVGLVLFSVCWLVGWVRVRVKQVVMSRYVPALPQTRMPEKAAWKVAGLLSRA